MGYLLDEIRLHGENAELRDEVTELARTTLKPIVKEAVIKGRFLGKLFAEQSLTVYSTAEIKGSFTIGRLVIPPANHFRWAEQIKITSAEIGGELAANLLASETVLVKSTARLFGDVEAANLVVEAGAIIMGRVRIGPKT